MEFFGPGVKNLSMDYRCGIDVMTTETACLSSVWSTDETVKEYLGILGRGDAYQAQAPADGAWYDGVIEVDLSAVEPMIALPFHPSNAFTIKEFKANMADLLHQVEEDAVRQLELKNGAPSLTKKIQDGLVPRGPGRHRRLLRRHLPRTWSGPPRSSWDHAIGSDALLALLLPGSMPINLELTKQGYIADLMAAGASHPLLLLRPLLRRRRRARQRRLLHPPLHPQLPQPEGSKPPTAR